MVFYQGVPIYHCTHVTGPVDQYSAECEYDAACNLRTVLSNSRMQYIELLNKDTDVVPEQAPLVILDRKSSILMANNGKDTKLTSHIFRRMHFVRNGKKCNFHKEV